MTRPAQEGFTGVWARAPSPVPVPMPLRPRSPSRIALAALAAAVLGSCRSAAAPDAAPGVLTAVRVLPGSAPPGAAVTLVAIATNAWRDTVFASQGCGHGLGFEVTAPDGGAADPSAGPSICPLFDSNVLAPGETDSVRFRWTAPATAGVYRVRAGVRGRSGLRWLSAPATLTVR